MSDFAGQLLAREGARLADELHGGLVQRVTAPSLAVDDALLHHAAGDAEGTAAALRTVRALADTTTAGCRALMDELGGDVDP